MTKRTRQRLERIEEGVRVIQRDHVSWESFLVQVKQFFAVVEYLQLELVHPPLVHPTAMADVKKWIARPKPAERNARC